MHEMSIAQSILDIALEEIAKQGCDRLDLIRVECGALGRRGAGFAAILLRGPGAGRAACGRPARTGDHPPVVALLHLRADLRRRGAGSPLAAVSGRAAPWQATRWCRARSCRSVIWKPPSARARIHKPTACGHAAARRALRKRAGVPGGNDANSCGAQRSGSQ